MSESSQLFALLETVFPIVKTEWEAFESMGDTSVKEVGKDFYSFLL